MEQGEQTILWFARILMGKWRNWNEAKGTAKNFITSTVMVEDNVDKYTYKQ